MLNRSGLLDLLDVDPIDRVVLARLAPDPAEVAAARAILAERLGSFPSGYPTAELSEQVWIAGYLAKTATVVGWQRERGIPPEVIAATMADFGRHLRLNQLTAVCRSWLLDPYLVRTLPDSQIAAFARRFTPYGELTDQPTDAVYFTFRETRPGPAGRAAARHQPAARGARPDRCRPDLAGWCRMAGTAIALASGPAAGWVGSHPGAAHPVDPPA